MKYFKVIDQEVKKDIFQGIAESNQKQKIFDDVAKIFDFEKAQFAEAGFYSEIGDVFCGGFIGGEAEKSNAGLFFENEFGLFEPQCNYLKKVLRNMTGGLEIAETYSLSPIWGKLVTYQIKEEDDGSSTRGGVLGTKIIGDDLFVAISEEHSLISYDSLEEITEVTWGNIGKEG